MGGLHIVQSFSKQNIGNIYSFTSMKLCTGLSKVLVALSDAKVYFVDCEELTEDEEVSPIIKEVSFTSIPGKMFPRA